MNERIEEELKEIKKSEIIIKAISSKTKNMKKQQTSSSLNFEYMKEMNFLNQKQLKLENEILILLDDINTSNQIQDNKNLDSIFLKEFYELMSFEKKIKLDFNKNLNMINGLIRNSDNEDHQTSQKLIEFVKKFNNDLVNFSEEDIEILLDLENFHIKLDEEQKLIEKGLNENENLSFERIPNNNSNDKNETYENNNKIELKKNVKLEIQNKENILSWFTYENMLQIIDIDPFNILSTINLDLFAIQELIFFDNTSFILENASNNSKKFKKIMPTGFYINNCITKEYIFDKENKFIIFVKSSNDKKEKAKAKAEALIKNSNKNTMQVEKKLNKKEGKFITELKTINEKDELNREELDIKFSIIKEYIENLIMQFTRIDKLNSTIDKKLIEKSYLYLGDEETIKIIENFTKAHDLSYIKICYDYRDLIQNLLKEINKKKIGIKFKTKNLLHNINFLYRSLNLTNDKKDNFFKRLTLEFPFEKREIILDFNNLIDFLYTFRNRKKILLDSYNKEIQELKSEIEKIIQESIENFKNSLAESLKIEKFNDMKNEMKNIHEKNKEIFELKQKILEEKKQKESTHLKQELEKKEKKLKEYYDEIRFQTEKYKIEKHEKVKKERIELEKEIELKNKKSKEEIKIKLPLIMQRQAQAQNVFIDQYKAKELKLQKKEDDIIRLNNIVENLKVRPKVDIDPQRVKKLTENLQKRFTTKRDETDRIILFKNNGFTVDNLMSDLRYKITTVLGEAGLLNREYTNDFLRNFYNPQNN